MYIFRASFLSFFFVAFFYEKVWTDHQMAATELLGNVSNFFWVSFFLSSILEWMKEIVDIQDPEINFSGGKKIQEQQLEEES